MRGGLRHNGAMSSLLRSSSMVALLLGLAAGAVLLVPPVVGRSEPALVTTDTPQYCLQLLDRVSELVRVVPSPPPEVTNLSTEGQRMCGEGQTRGGIMRLRRALVLLKQHGTEP